jgi:hypothetical protein
MKKTLFIRPGLFPVCDLYVAESAIHVNKIPVQFEHVCAAHIKQRFLLNRTALKST